MPWILRPPVLVLFCWAFSGAVAAVALSLPDRFDLLPILMGREDLRAAVFSGLGGFWLLTAFAAFAVGAMATGSGSRERWRGDRVLDLVAAARATFILNLVLLVVTGIWLALSAYTAGGAANLVRLAAADALTTRDLLLENKLFTGMRVFYAVLPATAAIAAALLASGPGRRAGRLCWFVLATNTVTLAVLPIVMSQRLLLLQLLLSAYLAVCLVTRRIAGLQWLLFAGFLFFVVWMLRESLTNPLFGRSAADLALQKIAFYAVNDMSNAFAPIGADGPRMFGAVSLRGLMFLTRTDGIFDTALRDRLMDLDTLRGGGEFPLLTAPFVDFGPVGGTLFLAGAGLVCGALFRLSERNALWAAVYAQVGAGLLFSTHGLYLTHQNQLAGILLVAGVGWLARARTGGARRGPPAADRPGAVHA